MPATALRAAVAGPAADADAADAHPLVAAAAAYAAERLRPAALTTDAVGVTAEQIDDLADLGLLNHLAGERYGGAALGRAEDRRIHEHVSSACLNTWLVWAQHAPLARRVESALVDPPPPGGVIDALLRGRILAGAGLSDVRRYPQRYVAARSVGEGWRLTGTVSWVSGWGLNQAMLVAGVDAERERVVLALVPIDDRFTAQPIALTAVAGSRTARVRLEEVVVPSDLVLDVQPLERWRRADRESAVDAKPHLFGFAAHVLAELAQEPAQAARDVVAAWTPRVRDLRARAYALADAEDAEARFAERLEVRIASGEALTTLARALLIVRAGRGLEREDSAQYCVRSAHFLLVQAQTESVRAAWLERLQGR
ncbi:alkylation response protein AidB-like acyl-CoA dehydrogenase [Microbacterium terrae]|uniref:acyl-CoA dehydrogenase family protein n=1 Tax=Microbacterium terrae TaxID=69369 RepID=UPI0005EC918F|nr:acyl-CoA dehydrogenase family protein [Microbacterium terrae]MBP1078431.1 alkylation response protein AidB-like acyl-CoA dehydrogenase [Microbacterium terrae]